MTGFMHLPIIRSFICHSCRVNVSWNWSWNLSKFPVPVISAISFLSLLLWNSMCLTPLCSCLCCSFIPLYMCCCLFIICLSRKSLLIFVDRCSTVGHSQFSWPRGLELVCVSICVLMWGGMNAGMDLTSWISLSAVVLIFYNLYSLLDYCYWD